MTWRDEWIRRWKDEGLNEDEYPLDELPIVNESPYWVARRVWRRTACQNRPGLRMMYVNVKDADGEPIGGIHIEFGTEPGSNGNIYDHPDVWGETGSRYGRVGYAEWRHPGLSNRYQLRIEGELLIENIRTDLAYEYCRGRGQVLGGWIPVNRPGVYSYDIEIQRRGEGD